MTNFTYSRTLHHYETDADGVCHFSNYLRIFEESFEYSLEQLGLASKTLEHSFAVVGMQAEYTYPLRAGDAFNVAIAFPYVKRSFIEASAVISVGESQSATVRIRLAAIDRATNGSISVSRLLREKLNELVLERL